MPLPQMRRKKQELDHMECVSILEDATTGVLAVHGDDGYPYAVPLNFLYDDGSIIFHCAKRGHKIDSIMRDPKVSFCVVARDDVIPELFATAYESVIAFGIASIIEDDSERRTALEAFARKHNPDEEAIRAEIDPSFDRTLMVRIDIEHMTGKRALNLM